jgi:hypothetical protein
MTYDRNQERELLAEQNTREDCFLEHPGLAGYAYKAEVYCPECARGLDFGEGPWDHFDFRNSEKVPQPFTASSLDEPTFCSSCRTRLAGGEGDDEASPAGEAGGS